MYKAHPHKMMNRGISAHMDVAKGREGGGFRIVTALFVDKWWRVAAIFSYRSLCYAFVNTHQFAEIGS